MCTSQPQIVLPKLLCHSHPTTQAAPPNLQQRAVLSAELVRSRSSHACTNILPNKPAAHLLQTCSCASPMPRQWLQGPPVQRLSCPFKPSLDNIVILFLFDRASLVPLINGFLTNAPLPLVQSLEGGDTP